MGNKLRKLKKEALGGGKSSTNKSSAEENEENVEVTASNAANSKTNADQHADKQADGHADEVKKQVAMVGTHRAQHWRLYYHLACRAKTSVMSTCFIKALADLFAVVA